jgi:hypothetical protein
MSIGIALAVLLLVAGILWVTGRGARRRGGGGAAPALSPLRDDVRAVAWWVLVGAAAGAIAGFLVGGIGGRLAMLVLRLTSPDAVIGATSDDGFEIGVLSTDTFNLVAGMTMFGGLNGVVYAAVRGWLPARLRLPLWTLVSAVVVGTAIVHEDGVDFTLIEPVALAIALFVAIPAAAAALVVVLVERWVEREPFASRRLSALVVLAAIAGTFALVIGAVVGLVALAGRRTGAGAVLGPVARIAAPLAICAVALGALVDLVGKTSRLL